MRPPSGCLPGVRRDWKTIDSSECKSGQFADWASRQFFLLLPAPKSSSPATWFFSNYVRAIIYVIFNCSIKSKRCTAENGAKSMWRFVAKILQAVHKYQQGSKMLLLFHCDVSSNNGRNNDARVIHMQALFHALITSRISWCMIAMMPLQLLQYCEWTINQLYKAMSAKKYCLQSVKEILTMNVNRNLLFLFF